MPEHWGLVQGAIWMIGIAVLAITGWWWPGIMIVVAISLLTEAAVRYSLKNQEDKQSTAAIETDLEAQRAKALPDKCPSCGSPVTVKSAVWTAPFSASCPFCATSLPMNSEESSPA